MFGDLIGVQIAHQSCHREGEQGRRRRGDDRDPTLHVEICVGLVNDDEEFDRLFARMLLSRDPDDRRCQIQWQDR